MKRKRKNAGPSSLLDDSPKRTKVHAQRKFAQGSNVNSPVITPIRELERESPQSDVLPEPVELLPIKRPNTEDFLTFLCFRGTPLLPPNLNFFNTASIVDTNGQVHEIKSESSPKNGPIDIAKCSSSSEKPFVAFGVRKRADPIVISRQMDRKRRHALALQALRRKYQEQKMAKIRALTISKLSEKVTNRTLVRTNTVSKTETITKKTNTNTLQKTKVVATTKHIKVTTRTLKTSMRPKLKIKQQNMCLRSFRGRFIQQELPRKKALPNKPIRSSSERKVNVKKKNEEANTSRTSEPSTSKQSIPAKRKIKVTSAPGKGSERSTRSSIVNTTSEIRRKQIKRILLPTNPHTIIIKPKTRSLRVSTMKKSVLSRKQNKHSKVKSKSRQNSRDNSVEGSTKKESKTEHKKSPTLKGDSQKIETRNLKETINQTMQSKESNRGKDITKDYKKVTDLKELKSFDRNKRHLTRSLDNRKQVNISTDFKRRPNLAVGTKKSKISNVIHKKINVSKSKNETRNTKKTPEGNSKTTEEPNKRVTRQRDGSKNANTSEMANENEKQRSSGSKNKIKTIDEDEKSDSDAKQSDKGTSLNTRKHKIAGKKVDKESSKTIKDKSNKKTNKTAIPIEKSDKEESTDTEKELEKMESVKKTKQAQPKSEEKESNTSVEKVKKLVEKSEKNTEEEQNISKDNVGLKQVKNVEKESITNFDDDRRKSGAKDEEECISIEELEEKKDNPHNTNKSKQNKNEETDSNNTEFLKEDSTTETDKTKENDLGSKENNEESDETSNQIICDKLKSPKTEISENQVKQNIVQEIGDTKEKPVSIKDNKYKDKSKEKDVVDTNTSVIHNIEDDEDNTEVSNISEKLDKRKSTIMPEKSASSLDESENEPLSARSRKKDESAEKEDSTKRKSIVTVEKSASSQEESGNEPLSARSRKKDVAAEKEDNTKRKSIVIIEESASSLDESKNEPLPRKSRRKDASAEKEDSTKKKSIVTPEESASSQDESKNEPLSTKSRRKEAPAEKEDSTPRSQRPSRKTKEAAAIYMEILSHKLVNYGRGDDDNISIDSFPELPCVKRTEQRENELKAKAKTPKDDVKDEQTESILKEEESVENIQEATVNIDENDKIKVTGNEIVKESEINKDLSSSAEKEPVKPAEIKDNPKNVKRKPSENPTEVEEVVTKPKLRKSDSKLLESAKEVEEPKPRRLRYSLPTTFSDDQDSDESFHIDIKVPRKKKNTRSRVSTRVTKVTKSLNISSSDSDHSTTSDVNIQPSTSSQYKSKKFSKTKSMKKNDTYSDSDDEPLSNRATKTVDGSQKSMAKSDKTKENKTKESGKSASKSKQKAPEAEIIMIEPKPKRECAKLPQNYLPMFSSSDEDEIFHGFDEKVETKTKTFEVACTHVPPLLDLLNKDSSRRFGKEKVNMSNEQIEKWLKDSALAGSSIKKENDEMLKFGERIPTETSLQSSESIDTEKLKQSLLELSKIESKDELKAESTDTTPVKTGDSLRPSDCSAKPQLMDRKLIFRKRKSETAAPNINAFSPENESSVYAFGEENEEVISTPFRRPSRRPSSTATSKSEDESSKHDESSRSGQFRKPTMKPETPKETIKDDSEPSTSLDLEDSKQFYIPQKPTKTTLLKSVNKALFKSRSSEKLPDNDEFKYKIPSSPSASSSSSAKLYKRQTQKQKTRSSDPMTPNYVSDFPKHNEPAKLVEAPVFHPNDQEFQDPLEYIERIRHKAEQFGICKIVPPSSFKPECKVTDDMRFTSYNQYVNKMLYRWGPNFKEFMAIKKYLETQSISLSHPPWIGGMEIDLPRLYQTVQTLGGLKEVIEKKKWSKVSEFMKIPKSAQDRVTKLDDIYCKYLLPYDTLSPAEREKLFDDVETEWAKRESRNLVKSQEEKLDTNLINEEESEDAEDDSEECITKGRSMALNAFYRIARNTMSMYFKTPEPVPQEVEQEYWKYVVMRENHICVHSGSIDCGNWGYGFAVTKNSPFAKHPWNLKMLTNNSGSVLRSLGPLMGVTVPTLHVGMVFSASCWYRDPHGLPWIEYLHTGGTKIWYGVPNSMGNQFQSALKTLVPNYVKNKELWLPSDSIMVPPNLLVEHNVSLSHAIQEPGQFIVVFPKAFTSSICTGYVVSESVFFAPIYWLKTARVLFDSLTKGNEPTMFSLDRLLISVVNDGKCNIEIIRQTLPLIRDLCGKELDRREQLLKLGEINKERLPIPEVSKGKKKKFQQGEGDYECEMCRSSLFLSLVFDTVEGITYCLEHAISAAEKNELNLSNCKFMFTYDDEELKEMPDKVKAALDNRLLKKVPNKFAGMPTLLGKHVF